MRDRAKKPLLSAETKKILWGPLSAENPILVQILGVCSALAVTAKLQPAFVMGVSVTIATGLSCFVLSMLRNTIPNRIRIIVQLVVISMLVILIDQFLKAFMYDISKQLSVFVGLIITNCILMGRVEAYALSHKPVPSLLDGMANGAGYALILIIIGVIREFFGSGTLWGARIIPESFYAHGYFDNSMMLLPPMALLIVGALIWVHRSRNKNLVEK